MLRVTCGCGAGYRIEDRFAGRTLKCKRCGGAIRIPPAAPGGGAAAGPPPARPGGDASPGSSRPPASPNVHADGSDVGVGASAVPFIVIGVAVVGVVILAVVLIAVSGSSSTESNGALGLNRSEGGPARDDQQPGTSITRRPSPGRQPTKGEARPSNHTTKARLPAPGDTPVVAKLTGLPAWESDLSLADQLHEPWPIGTEHVIRLPKQTHLYHLRDNWMVVKLPIRIPDYTLSAEVTPRQRETFDTPFPQIKHYITDWRVDQCTINGVAYLRGVHESKRELPGRVHDVRRTYLTAYDGHVQVKMLLHAQINHPMYKVLEASIGTLRRASTEEIERARAAMNSEMSRIRTKRLAQMPDPATLKPLSISGYDDSLVGQWVRVGPIEIRAPKVLIPADGRSAAEEFFRRWRHPHDSAKGNIDMLVARVEKPQYPYPPISSSRVDDPYLRRRLLIHHDSIVEYGLINNLPFVRATRKDQTPTQTILIYGAYVDDWYISIRVMYFPSEPNVRFAINAAIRSIRRAAKQ